MFVYVVYTAHIYEQLKVVTARVHVVFKCHHALMCDRCALMRHHTV